MSEIAPESDLREVADQINAQARTFLSTVTQVASGGMPGAELSLLVLASSDLLAAGARLAAWSARGEGRNRRTCPTSRPRR